MASKQLLSSLALIFIALHCIWTVEASDYTVDSAVDSLFNDMQNGGTTVQHAKLIVSVSNEKIDLGTTYQASTSLLTVQHRLIEFKAMYTHIVENHIAESHLAMYKRGVGKKPIFVAWRFNLFPAAVETTIKNHFGNDVEIIQAKTWLQGIGC